MAIFFNQLTRLRTFSLLLLLTACAQKHDAAESDELVKKPVDEATAEERAQIEATVEEIEALVADTGQPRRFRKVPIILSTDDRTWTGNPGACIKADGRAQFILVKRVVLQQEEQLAREGVESTLFRVLLHEIGHCYYDRDHDDTRIYQAGDSIELAVDRGVSHDEKREYPMLDATVMASDTLFLPIALKKYYVAELLGLARAQTLEDLVPYASVRWMSSKPKEQK